MIESENSGQSSSIHTDQSQSPLSTDSSREKPHFRLIKGLKLNSAQSQSGRWTEAQQAQYTIFLTDNADLFSSIKIRRNQKVFKLISGFVKTRSATQCRSHHQKMLKKCGTLENIISYRGKSLSCLQIPSCGQDISDAKLNIQFKVLGQKLMVNSAFSKTRMSDIPISLQDPQEDEMVKENAGLDMDFFSPRIFLQPGHQQFWRLDDLYL